MEDKEQEEIDLLIKSVDYHSKNTNERKIIFETMQKLAEQGNADAQFFIGEHYSEPSLMDFKTAFEWYKKAAEQGHALAQWQLGNSYDMGRGCERNHGIAAKWWQKSAEQGNKYARRKLDSLNRDKTDDVLSFDEIDDLIDGM